MFWGLVFAFLYVLHVYARAIDILEFWKRVTTGSKILTIGEENFGIKNSSRFQ